MKLDDKALAHLTYQNYLEAASITGVFYHPLKKHRALEGAFMEYLRLKDGRVEGLPVPFEARQFSVSWAVPGRINAFHLHPKRTQDELWCVVQGALLVWLVDVRADSPTKGAKRSFLLSGEAPSLLYIPSGVAHGYRAGYQGALLLYAMNDQFNPSDPNEGRLPWDFFGADLWADDKG
ncbi:MAG: dTDP-4-dehydrorhamnose 3,5-epimerase family protein [Meiothermus ruber]|jgi:dTDP-4-dehydrorhamnose 3,5-epimerase|uniref:dTDP-4-dehydrorhamnose 3,5-epimerase family protein n=1 Tax=Meiothermus ruber TaxID=277 RepID=UPI0023F75655|nr:dTDP-4-dehydrorhamnose 3,5-epimerase family protein [Meiothermus ruber]MCL6529462.1 dTDP-4-dehydrorhamnose 3,5-epimerase family protein [Meiothermus ruber]